MRTQIGAALALAALAAAPPVRAQVGQVGVQVRLLYDVESIFAGDFVPEGSGQQSDFLSLVLNNGSTQAQNVRLQVMIRQERPRSAELFRGLTDPFVLAPGLRRLTNRDLTNRGSDVVIEEYDLSSEVEELNNQVLRSAQLPAGAYLIEVAVLRAGPTPTPIGQDQVRLELVNPSRVELLSPGRPFGDSPEVVFSGSPRFQWTADPGLGIGAYRIRVVPAEGAASPEEAMQAFPSWEATVNTTSALYPGAVSAIPLAAGKTYAWQVTRELQTSGGGVFLNSPIYWFRMAGGADPVAPDGRPAGGELGAALQLETLGRALGLGGQLQGFRPTGHMIVDGKVVSGDNLEALLRAILAGQVSVHSITVR
jgi:hypothetical protein